MSSRLDRDPAYQDFLAWVRDNSQPGLIDPASDDKPRMLDAHVLQAYFKENNHSKLKKLLRIAFPIGELPVNAEKVAENCAQGFCTLLLIGRPEYIQQFVLYDRLHDSQLPFDDQYPPRHFPKCTTDEDQGEFLRRFCQNQWIFCAPKIDSRERRIFEDSQVLPINVKKRLGGGISANLYEIEIYPTYNQLGSLNVAQQSPDQRITNTYVLKTYFGKGAEEYYNSEVDAFKRLRKRTQNLIGFYGGFRQGDRYNIILEFADVGTLEDYFKSIPPPTTGEDIIAFWEHLFELIEALLCVHEGEIEVNPDGTSQPLHGWHQDVKPSNILVTTLDKRIQSSYEWLFKLADLGISHFKTLDSSAQVATDGDSQGTRTYGAPECCRPDETLGKCKIKVTQTVDVWSLGAVFSEAAVWLVESYQSLKVYRQHRRAAANYYSEVKGTDCFHDGQKMLDIVAQWHKRLNAGLRNNDLITVHVLSMIEHMLYDETSRPGAKYLWTWSRKILENAKEELENRKQGSVTNTPTKLRPPTSSTYSDSTSSASSLPDMTASNIGRFGVMDRVMSPPTMQETSNFDLGEIGRQLDRNGSLHNNSTQVAPHYPATSHQIQSRNVTFEGSTNAPFNPNIGARAQSHDVRSTQPMQHQVTRSMSGLDTHREDEFDHNSQDWINSRNAVSMPPGTSGQFGENVYRTSRPPRGETSDSFGTFRPVQESFRHDAYAQPDFSQGRGLPVNTVNNYHGYLDEGPHRIANSSRTPNWQQGNSSSQQQYTNAASINHDAHPGGDGRGIHMLERNQTSASVGWAGPASPAPQHTPVTQRREGFHQNGLASMIEPSPQARTSTSPPQPSIFTPPEAIPSTLEPAPPKARYKPPAVLPIGTAISFLARGGKVAALDGYNRLFPRLKQRDHVFIVDDALSMLTHWNDVEAVFGIMAKIVKAADPNGIDLHFTMSDEVYNSKNFWGHNSSSKLVEYVRERRHKIQGTINITYRLDAILGLYISKLNNAVSSGGSVTPLNIYVLTDGVWEPGCNPSSAIKNLIDKLTAFGYSKDSKQVGIQFVSFGKHRDGLKRLNDLDNNLGQAMDIVDTTASNGNVWKMLLGAIEEAFDES